MDPDDQPAAPRTRTEIGAPTHASGLTRDDYLVIYGPLGIGWLILLAMMGVLWKDRNAQRREFLLESKRKDDVHTEELERRDKECKEERTENRAAMISLTKEQDETMKQLDDRWRDVTRELRAALESAVRKISRRE